MDWIENIGSAWKGHRKFAEWLVYYIQPEIIVELGVDFGYSSFVFANALSAYNCDGIIYSIDSFEGDIYTGVRNTYDFVSNLKIQYNLDKLIIIRGEFTEESKKWNKEKKIDILHIDGLHTYDAVKNDFECWSQFVADDGVILFHDVESFKDVRDFFYSINDGNKMYFVHSAGLGIYTKNEFLAKMIKRHFSNIIPL